MYNLRIGLRLFLQVAGPLLILASPWSPPPWMKLGAKKGKGGGRGRQTYSHDRCVYIYIYTRILYMYTTIDDVYNNTHIE